MIRFRATSTLSGKPILGMILVPENLRRLRNGEPIVMSGASVGCPDVADVVVMFAESAEAAVLLLHAAGAIGHDTTIHREEP